MDCIGISKGTNCSEEMISDVNFFQLNSSLLSLSDSCVCRNKDSFGILISNFWGTPLPHQIEKKVSAPRNLGKLLALEQNVFPVGLFRQFKVLNRKIADSD